VSGPGRELVALVLAAGRARRMGSPKQLADLGGRPLLEHVLAAMAASGVDRVVVALGAAADQVLASVPLHGAEPMRSTRWPEGMGAVLAEAASALRETGTCAGLVVALGDQPLVTPAVVARLADAWRDGAGPVVSSAYDGRPGNPKLFDAALLAELAGLDGDTGARELLAAHPEWTHLVETGPLGSDLDVDDEAGLAEVRRLVAAQRAAAG
jgi:CTP:molybdopterin cytidylyltransferase MocA